MKKVVCILVLSLIVLSVSQHATPILANDLGMIEFLREDGSLGFKEYSLVEESMSTTFISMKDATDEEYFLTIQENIIYISNDNGKTIGSLVSRENKVQSTVVQREKYGLLSTETWSPFSFMGSSDTYISWDEQLVVETAISVITILLKSFILAWVGVAAIITYSAVTNMYTNKAHNILISRYMATWVGCPILIKEYFQFHNLTMTRHYGTSYQSPRWIGDKWNYSYLAVCRTTPY